MTLTREDAAALAAANGLIRVDQAADFRDYIRDCWRLRHFTWNFAVARTIVATVQNNLGLLWEVLTPVLLSITYYLAFGVLLGTKQDSPDFIIFLICGVFTWRLFNQGLIAVSASLGKSKDLTQSLLFPRVLVPIASTTISHTSPGFMKICGLRLLPTPPGVPVTMTSPGESGMKVEM